QAQHLADTFPPNQRWGPGQLPLRESAYHRLILTFPSIREHNPASQKLRIGHRPLSPGSTSLFSVCGHKITPGERKKLPMNHATHLKVTAPFLRHRIEQPVMWRRFLLVAFALFSFAHSSTLMADDPSDTALGYNAFVHNTS